MPKIPSLTPEKVIKILIANGFILDHQTGSHRVYYNEKTKKRAVLSSQLLVLLRQIVILRSSATKNLKIETADGKILHSLRSFRMTKGMNCRSSISFIAEMKVQTPIFFKT